MRRTGPSTCAVTNALPSHVHANPSDSSSPGTNDVHGPSARVTTVGGQSDVGSDRTMLITTASQRDSSMRTLFSARPMKSEFRLVNHGVGRWNDRSVHHLRFPC